MQLPQQYVTSERTYRTINAAKDTIFETGASFPAKVVTEGFRNCKFLTFVDAFIPEFWDVLLRCMDQGGDTEVYTLTISPDPETHYRSKYGYFGAAAFSRETTREAYHKVVSFEPGGDWGGSLKQISLVAAWFGNSGTWAFWGQREYDTVVAAARSNEWKWPVVERIDWLDAVSALDVLISDNLRDGEVPDSFVRQFLQNYGAGDRIGATHQHAADIRREIVRIASAILNGSKRPFPAIRDLARLSRAAHVDGYEEFSCILTMDRDTHYLPDDPARRLYSPEYLSRAEAEVEGYLQRNMSTLMQACRKIVEKFRDH